VNEQSNSAPEALRLRRQAEERLLGKVQAKPGPEPVEDLQRLNHELQVHQIELEIQNEELHRAKNDAEKSLARFHDLYELAPVGYLTLNTNGTILAVNLTGASLLGEDRSRLVGHPFQNLLSNSQQSSLLELLNRVFASQQKQYCEVTLKPSGKTEIYVRLDAQADNSGKQCRVALVDITDLRQEELYHLQLECVEGYSVCLLDNRGTILNWNPGAQRLQGYRPEEIIGKSFSCFYSEKDREDGKPEQELRKAAAEGRYAAECWRVRKDGSGFWADVVLTPLRDEKGQPWGFSKVTHDISDRKKAQEELGYSEARYRALFEDNPTIIFTLDADWAILSANSMALSQLGYAKDELEGQSVLKLVCPEDRAAVAEQFQRCLNAPNELYHWQFRKLCKDGRLLWVEDTAQVTFGIDGEPVILVVCQDVTERKLVQEEREQLLLQLEAVLENINEAVVITDLDANVLSMNRAALALYGFGSDDVKIHRPLESYLDTFEISDLEGQEVSFENWPLVRAIRGESFNDCELRSFRKDTGRSWIGSYNGSLVRSKSSDVALAVITVRDITDGKRVEEAFRKSEARFHAIFNLAAVGIAQIGLDGQWLLMNRKLSAILGYSFAELERMTLQQISHPDDLTPHLEHVRALVAGEVPSYAMEKRYFRKDGSIVWVNLNVTLVRDPHNEPEYFISIVEDISERKKADLEIKRLNLSLAERAAELEAANEELEAFNYTVAHDLRQPINIITSCCQVVERLFGGELEKDCRGHIELAYKTALRMDRLIGALLNFARMGHVELHRVDVDLGAMAYEVAGSLKLAEPEREVDFRAAGGMIANGDPNLLRVVLSNLLGNAWKYTTMRKNPVIEVGVREIDGVQAYFVRDNGAGFAGAEADKLFAPFQRLPGAEKQRGFGIGLATVERIVRRHGGKVWAEGEPDRGACFYFTLTPS
jgi:PAS domain S-box-containing protein